MTLTTGESSPINIAPLYNLGSSLFLKVFKFLIFNNDEIFPIKLLVKAFLPLSNKISSTFGCFEGYIAGKTVSYYNINITIH